MIEKRFNYNYRSAPNDLLPEFLGDRVYAQDFLREMQFLFDKIFRVMFLQGDGDYSDGKSFLFLDGTLAQGVGDTVDIPAGNGIVEYDVEIPDSFSSLPPAKLTRTIKALVEWPASANTPLVGGQINDNLFADAVLDNVTTNYVKVRYKEIALNSRNRAQGDGGNYDYEVEVSYEVVIDDTAATDEEILIGTFTGDGAGTVTIGTTAADRDDLAAFRVLHSALGNNYESWVLQSISRYVGQAISIKHGDGSTPAENELDVKSKVIKGLLAGSTGDAAARLADFPFRNYVEFTTTTLGWPIPAGVDNIYVEAGGGGGGGGGASVDGAEYRTGGGGASGEWRRGVFNLVGETSLDIVIASGGGGGSGGLIASDGTSGGSTTITSQPSATLLMQCNGGGGGGAGGALVDSGVGGDSATPGAGGIKFISASGGAGIRKGSIVAADRLPGGAGGGPEPGSRNVFAPPAGGEAGGAASGGQGGECSNSTFGNGGNGGNGIVRIWY